MNAYCSSRLTLLSRAANGLWLLERAGDGYVLLYPCWQRGEVCS